MWRVKGTDLKFFDFRTTLLKKVSNNATTSYQAKKYVRLIYHHNREGLNRLCPVFNNFKLLKRKNVIGVYNKRSTSKGKYTCLAKANKGCS